MDLEALSSVNRERLRRFIDGRLLAGGDPRLLGSALTGKLSGLWRYRVGDLRLIAKIVDQRMVIIVVGIGHRREVYR